MANYWDTFKPGLLAGEDYWEDFTPEAPTETGVVGAVTGKRYQPWEKGYHNIAGLVDDSGEYDAWYDPDPPPETSMPDWGTPEGYDNWKNRIALETGSGNTNVNNVQLIEGGQDQEITTSSAALDFDQLKDWAGNLDKSKVVLSLASGQPLMVGMALFGNKIDGIVQSVFDLFKDDPLGGDPGTSGVDQDPQTGAGTGSMSGEYT